MSGSFGLEAETGAFAGEPILPLRVVIRAIRFHCVRPSLDLPGGLRQLILAACDFLAEVSSGCQKHQRQFEPLVESQMKAVMCETLLPALRGHGMENPELRATMVTWAIAGAALQWSREKKTSAEAFANAVLPMVHAPLTALDRPPSHPPGAH
jgi:hypothetical protein